MTTAQQVGGAVDFRVLDLTDESGVYGAKMMADMGADVIKVEPLEGDRARRYAPFFHNEPGLERSLYFMGFNANKRGVTLDLESSVGREVFRELVKTADVLMESFPVGYMASLGLGYRDLSRINPKLVMTSITPYGQTGPFRYFKGTDITAWAMGGTQISWGRPDRVPLNVTGSSYIYSGMNAAVGTLAAIWARDDLGAGQYVDISVQESVLAFTTESGPPKYLDDLVMLKRHGRLRAGNAPSGYYPCKDGAVCVVIGNPDQWDRFAKWIAEVTGDETALEEMYRGTVAQRWVVHEAVNYLTEKLTTLYSKTEMFNEAREVRDIPVTPVNDVADLLADLQLRARNFWVEVDHPEVGKITFPGAPYVFSETPWSIRRPAPLLGQHNEEIYVGELGLSREVLEALKPRPS